MHINKFVGTKSEKTITEGMIQAAVAWPHLLKTLSFGYLTVCEFAICYQRASCLKTDRKPVEMKQRRTTWIYGKSFMKRQKKNVTRRM